MDSMESFFTSILKGFTNMKFTNTKKLCQFAAVFVLILVFLPAMAQEKQSSEKNAALVNGVAISMEQYTKELNIQIDRVSRQGGQVTDDQLAALKNDILDSLIEREVLYQQSQKDGIQITDQTIDDQLAAIKKRFPNETEYKNALSKMNLSEDEVKAQIKRGLSIKELIDQLPALVVERPAAAAILSHGHHPTFAEEAELFAVQLRIDWDRLDSLIDDQPVAMFP